MLGGREEGGLRWGGPSALRRHEHVKFDERWGDDAHLGVQRVEAQVDATQGGHGGQLLHGHICWGQKDRLGVQGPSRQRRMMKQEDETSALVWLGDHSTRWGLTRLGGGWELGHKREGWLQDGRVGHYLSCRQEPT